MAHDIEQTLSMDHITAPERVPLEELQKQIEERTEEKAEPKTEDPRRKKAYTFRFKHEDANGRVFSGIFTNNILDIGQRLKVAQLESNLNGGVSYDSMDPFMGSVSKAIAHLQFSLSAKEQLEPKDWAKDFRNLDNAAPLLELFEEVMAHEAIFLGVGVDSGKSDKQEAHA
jgi:hypothetical protein